MLRTWMSVPSESMLQFVLRSRSNGSDIAMRTFSPIISALRVPAMVSKVTMSLTSSPRWAVNLPKQRAPLPHISASPPSAL